MVMLAIYAERSVQQDWRRRERRAGITYDYTVRKLLPAFELDATQPGSFVQEMTIDLDPSWSVDHLGVAAFIQDPKSLKIEAASSDTESLRTDASTAPGLSATRVAATGAPILTSSGSRSHLDPSAQNSSAGP